MERNAFLILNDGTVFKGTRFGASEETIGEVVFTTGMSGFAERLSDPGHYGHIVVQTFPLLGNAPIAAQELVSESFWPKGYIVRDWQASGGAFPEPSLHSLLEKHGVTGLYGLDTRALVRHLRDAGAQNGVISDTPEVSPAMLARLSDWQIRDAVEAVSVSRVTTYGDDTQRRHVALFDFGCRKDIITALRARDCKVTLLPAMTPLEDVLRLSPDGIVLSNGPGDPAVNREIIANLQWILKMGVPLFGIGLGHQLLALASGFRVVKLACGHRGANVPVKDVRSGRIYVTNQNHGYGVAAQSVPAQEASPRFISSPDGACEGLTYMRRRAFSVQFIPRCSHDPQDTGFLYDEFIRMLDAGMSEGSYA